jgi:predicted lipid-binding transport protein (Tim44 family)
MPQVPATLRLPHSLVDAVEAQTANATSFTGHMLGRLARGLAFGLAELITEVARAYTTAHVSPFLPAHHQGNRLGHSRF